MEKETIKNIFDFLEEKEGHKTPFLWKLANNIPLTEDELHINDDLDLSESDIIFLPEGLKVKGNLSLRYCTSLKSLPKGLKVESNLDVSDTYITSLPDNLYVGGYLSLDGCVILQSLPKGLKVGDNLFIHDTPLAKLSDEKIREMIEPGGYIKGIVR
jgi:hypothetical protein